MSGLVFLLVALGISLIGCVLLWMFSRKPTSLEHGIDEFSNEMRALSPEQPSKRGSRRR